MALSKKNGQVPYGASMRLLLSLNHYKLHALFIFLLPCQWKYWHRAKNRLRDKTGFGMYNPQNVEKSGIGQSVCVSVRPSV